MALGDSFTGTASDVAAAGLDSPVALKSVSFVNIVLKIDPRWAASHQGAKLDNVITTALGGGGSSGGGGNGLVAIFTDISDTGLSEDVGVNYAGTSVIGREEEYQTFTGTGNRQVQLLWQFVAQEGDPLTEVVQPARALDALKNPVPGPNGLSYAPPSLLLTIGKLFAGRCILTSSSIKWNGPFEPGSMYPHSAEVPTTFTVVRGLRGQENSPTGDTDEISRFLDIPYVGSPSS